MRVYMAHGVSAATVPTFPRRFYFQDGSGKAFPDLWFGHSEKQVTGKAQACVRLVVGRRQDKSGCCLQKRKVENYERKLHLDVQARVGERGDAQISVLEKGVDDAGINRDEDVSVNASSERRRRVQVVGKKGLVDLEEQLGLSKEKKRKARSSKRKKADGINANADHAEDNGRLSISSDAGGRMTGVFVGSESENGASLYSEEVKLRSYASNLVLAEVLNGNGSVRASDKEQVHLEGLEVNGNGSVSIKSEELNLLFNGKGESLSGLPNSMYTEVREGLARVEEQWPKSLAELPGGKPFAELVTAWDALVLRLEPQSSTSNSTLLLLAALKLAVAAVQRAAQDGPIILSNSLAVAYTLVDLEMNAEVVATGLLRDVVDAGLVNVLEVEKLSTGIHRLLHDCLRFKGMPARTDVLDDANAKAVRQFCLAYYDIHAIIVELAVRLNRMRHVEHLPRYEQQILALETMQIYAPLAHAVGTADLSMELEDRAFKILFPDSYNFLENWLKSHWPGGNIFLETCKARLLEALQQDFQLQELINGFTVLGRVKSRLSTMKKLLKDGRRREEVCDVLGLRIVVNPKGSDNSLEMKQVGYKACYRVLEIARSLWKEVPGRLKDYIAKPKSNGYESLHVALHLDDADSKCMSLELQIRTADMDAKAVDGAASHALYKGGLTDSEQVQHLKRLMMAAAERAALSLKDLAGELMHADNVIEAETKDHVFRLFDKNNDGIISMDEFGEVMGELGAEHDDALKLMQIVDTNTDGSVSPDEFADFQQQVRLLKELVGVDRQFSSKLGYKLKDNDITSGNSRSISASIPDLDIGSDQNQSSIGISSNDLEGMELRSTPESNSEPDKPLKVLDFSEQSLLESPKPDPSTDDEQCAGVLELESVDLIVNEPQEAIQDQSSQSFVGWNEAEALRLERIENSSKSSTSNGESEEGNLNSYIMGVKSLNLLKPVRSASIVAVSAPDLGESESRFWQSLDSSRSETWVSSEARDVGLSTQQTGGTRSSLEEGLAILRRFVASKNMSAARGLVKQLLEEHPADGKLLAEYAYLEKESGDLVAAGALYSQAIRAFKADKTLGYDYIRALQCWGSLEAQARNARRARFLFMESISAARKEEIRLRSSVTGAAVYGLHAWARLEERLGNWSKARDLLARAAELQPGNAIVHQSRALLEARAHNFSASRHHFRLAVEAAPNDVKCWQAWALFEASQGKRRQMRKYFKQALEADPRNIPSLQAWARQEALIGTEEAEVKARKLYQRCIEIDPKNMYSWQAWAVLEKKLGNHTEARKLFEQGLKVNPSSVPCLQAFAHMERTNGNLEFAQKILKKALKVEPENAAVLMEAALVEEKLGNKLLAEELFKQAGMADKQKSRVKRRMFESKKSCFSGDSQCLTLARKARLRKKIIVKR